MALRASSGPTQSTRSLKAGEALVISAKVENTAGEPAELELVLDDAKHPMTFAPTRVTVAPKTRERVAFTWSAALPEGTDALTYRGKLVLRAAPDGKVVGSAPLDVYVSR